MRLQFLRGLYRALQIVEPHLRIVKEQRRSASDHNAQEHLLLHLNTTHVQCALYILLQGQFECNSDEVHVTQSFKDDKGNRLDRHYRDYVNLAYTEHVLNTVYNFAHVLTRTGV